MAPPKVLKARICFCLSGQCLQTNQSSRGSLQTRRRQKCSLEQADLRRFGGYCCKFQHSPLAVQNTLQQPARPAAVHTRQQPVHPGWT